MNDLSKLAFAGLLSGLGLGLSSCAGHQDSHDKGHMAMAGDQSYSDTHGCAGMNSCKGLGGCAVKDEKLSKLAKKRGIPASMAGQAHGCAGQNACKGLGGCSVDAEKFAKLKKMRAMKK